MKKHILTAVLLALCLTALLCVHAMAADSGTDGNITWTLDDNGLLTISGTGAMKDYDTNWTDDGEYYTNAPWGTSAVSVVN